MKTPVFLLLFLCAGHFSQAQSDTAIAMQRAMLFADSLERSFRFNEWNTYISLSYPGVVKYYGGKEGFTQYAQRVRSVNQNISEEKQKLEILQMLNDIREWQCVIRKTRHTVIDGRNASVVSYIVGQSKDEGQTWRFFDVAYNSVENVIYIMPDIFDRLAIPQREIVFEKDQLARKK